MAVVYTLDENNIPQFCESNISVSSDKKYFAIGSTKGTIYVFNLMSGKVSYFIFLDHNFLFSLKIQLIINLLLTLLQFSGDLTIRSFMLRILPEL